ncbi:MAG: hypothetical protein H0T69_05245 [Thermoleophilaceae bacterium]|nr:hypothetical protein [Thermoleophilaceae bacterium]
MTELAQRTGAINIGQGFPDEDGSAVIIDAAVVALHAGHNQYAPLPGVPALRDAIAAHQRRHYGLAVDPDSGVQVTFTATPDGPARSIVRFAFCKRDYVLDEAVERLRDWTARRR